MVVLTTIILTKRYSLFTTQQLAKPRHLTGPLFYPVKNGSIKLIPQTEITTFDDAESAAIYYDTLVRYCEFNARNQEKTDAFPFMKQHIQDFYKLAQEHNKPQER